jgi:ABC-type multidrug transport system permease subunit
MIDLGRYPLYHLTVWRIREFTREPEALFWVFVFPVLLALALGLAFESRGMPTAHVAVQRGPGADALVATLDSAPGIDPVLLDSAEAYQRLRAGRVSLVVRPGAALVFQYDSTREESLVARLVTDRAVQRAGGREDVRAVEDVRVTEPGARYIDFLLPGLLGMGIMGTGMWGVGFGIVKTRKERLLKRLLASPMRRTEFLFAFMLSRLVFLGGEVGLLLLFGVVVFGVPVRGSIAAITAIVVLGALAFAGLGLLVASRSKTIEGVSGLLNVVMVPMWICSGVFFAYSNFPDVMQPFLLALPLTALNDALRAVMLDGTSLASTIPLLGIMTAWGVGSFGLALWIFRWH